MYVRCRKPLILLYFHHVRYEHSDHMKIIRTFSYLEKRSDYLFYLSIPISIARNEQLPHYVLKNNLKLIIFQLARYRQLKSFTV